jgi:hypothetical protein
MALITSLDDGVVDRVLQLNAGVRRLNLARNAIGHVTPAVGRLGGTLQSLDVSHNKLRALMAPSFDALPQLLSLHAAHNEMYVGEGVGGSADHHRVHRLDVDVSRVSPCVPTHYDHTHTRTQHAAHRWRG